MVAFVGANAACAVAFCSYVSVSERTMTSMEYVLAAISRRPQPPDATHQASAPVQLATPPPVSPPPMPSVEACARSGVTKVGNDWFLVDRSVVDTVLERQADLLRSTRIVPELEHGHVVGVRLYGIAPKSMLCAFGFEDGDRLEAINGGDLTSPDKALTAYVGLRTANHVTVRLTRGGRVHKLEYEII
jgi:general secretion pathway protein C